MFNIAFVINPIAGIGGKVGLKGSDGASVQEEAFKRGAKKEAWKKSRIALSVFENEKHNIHFYTAFGEMGSDLLKTMGFSFTTFGQRKKQTSFSDTQDFVKSLRNISVDLLIFAGGDGTARDVCSSIPADIPVLGIPAGVKIQSAVFGISALHSGKIILNFIQNKQKMRIQNREVMDIDESLLHEGIISAKLFGYLPVPVIKNMIQNPKSRGKAETENIEELTQDLKENMELYPDHFFIMSTGRTIFEMMRRLSFTGTLLGVDLVYQQQTILKDAREKEIERLMRNKKTIIVCTVIGGQGHVFGRGNSQISEKILSRMEPKDIWIYADPEKIYKLSRLVIDSFNPVLDKRLSGYYPVVIAYQTRLIVALNC